MSWLLSKGLRGFSKRFKDYRVRGTAGLVFDRYAINEAIARLPIENLPGYTPVTLFASGHGFTKNGTIGAVADDATRGYRNTRSVKMTTDGSASLTDMRGTISSIDATGKIPVLVVYCPDFSKITELQFSVSSDAFTNFRRWGAIQGNQGNRWIAGNEWQLIALPWQEGTNTGTPNRAAITRYQVRCASNGQGAVDLWVGGIAWMNKGASIATISFDDGYDTLYTKAWPVLKAKNLKFTAYVPAQYVDAPGRLSLAQIQEMIASGLCEIGYHGDGNDQRVYTAAQLRAIIETDLVYWKSKGIICQSGCYPGGEEDVGADGVKVRDIYAEYFSSARTVFKGQNEVLPPMDRLRLKTGAYATNAVTPAAVTTIRNNVLAEGGWHHEVYHTIVDSNAALTTEYLTSDFTTNMTNLAQSGLAVLKMSEAFSYVQPLALYTTASATALDASVVADAGSGVGIAANGWAAKITVPFQSGQTLDPTKITFTVRDPGFDDSGNPTFVTRTIKGTAILRRQYPNNASKQAGQVGSNYEAWFALSDRIYQGSVILSVTCAAGFYGTTPAESSRFANVSTLAYPKPFWGWTTMQHERATGSSFPVEGVAYHRHGRNGRSVACVQFIAKDAQVTPNVAATQTASTPSLSSVITGSLKPETYKANIPLTNLTQGDLCQVNVKVYPWIGDASAVLDLDVDGVAWFTQNPQTKLRFACDKTGAYGGAVACVKSGAVGGTVQTSLAAARATPFPTINAALTAIRTYNNANKGHDDHSGGAIYLMDNNGAAQDHWMTAGVGAVPVGKCWTDIMPDPANTGAVRWTDGGNYQQLCSLIRSKVNMYLAAATVFMLYANAAPSQTLFAIDGATFAHEAGGAAAAIQDFGIVILRNVTLTGITASNRNFFRSSNASQGSFQAYGVTFSSGIAGLNVSPHLMIACDFDNVSYADPNWTTQSGLDRTIFANNRFRRMRSEFMLGYNKACPNGLAIVQNVFERAIGASSPSISIGAGGNNPMTNLLLDYNTIPGTAAECRTIVLYTDEAGHVNIARTGSFSFNILSNLNMKSDSFTSLTTLSGRVGNWEPRHHVGCFGNVFLTGSSGDDVALNDGGAARWLGEVLHETSVTGSDASPLAVTFTDDKAGGAAATGLGTYTLTGITNPAYDRVPAGLGKLTYDIAGNARRTDGTGAAGAYERA